MLKTTAHEYVSRILLLLNIHAVITESYICLPFTTNARAPIYPRATYS